MVTSNVCSIPSVAGDAVCTVNPFDLFSLRGGIRRLIQDRSYRETIVQARDAKIRRLQATVIVNPYAQLCRAIVTECA